MHRRDDQRAREVAERSDYGKTLTGGRLDPERRDQCVLEPSAEVRADATSVFAGLFARHSREAESDSMRQHFGAESTIEAVAKPPFVLEPIIRLATPLVESRHGGRAQQRHWSKSVHREVREALRLIAHTAVSAVGEASSSESR